MYTNIPSDGDDQVGRLLSGLPRVSAPSDFDLRLRGRIAQRRSSPASGFRLPAAVTYALGLGVVLVAFGLVGVVWMYSGNVADVPVVAVSEKVIPAGSASVPDVRVPDVEVKTPSDVQVASKVADPAVTAKPSLNPAKRPLEPLVAPSAAGSRTESLRQSRKVFPMGIRDSSSALPDSETLPAGSITAKDVVSGLGAKAAFSGTRLLVDSVTAGSAAANAGLQPGDIILSINGQPVTPASGFVANFAAKALSVLRAGKLVPIVLVN